MKTVIISDMHNREFAVKDLFTKLGLMDENGNRAEGFYVISLGDIVSLGYEEKEAVFFEWVMNFVDTALIGNHEYPVINNSRYILFSGWSSRDYTAEQLVRKSIETTDKWQVATNVGKWLLTHAGLHPHYMDMLDEDCLTAAQIQDYLNERFEDYRLMRFDSGRPDRLFDGIGLARGGSSMHGGIFWNDVVDLLEVDHLVPQICGHSSYAEQLDNYPQFNKDLWCIDTKNSVNALVTEDNGKSFELVSSDIEYEYDEGRRSTNFHLKESVSV